MLPLATVAHLQYFRSMPPIAWRLNVLFCLRRYTCPFRDRWFENHQMKSSWYFSIFPSATAIFKSSPPPVKILKSGMKYNSVKGGSGGRSPPVRGVSFFMGGGGVEENVLGYEKFYPCFVGVWNISPPFCWGMKNFNALLGYEKFLEHFHSKIIILEMRKMIFFSEK